MQILAALGLHFSTISLTASTGYSSSEVKNLFDSDSRVLEFCPGINIPIFNAGKLNRNSAWRRSENPEPSYLGEQTIQTAFKDVADGLSGLRLLTANNGTKESRK